MNVQGMTMLEVQVTKRSVSSIGRGILFRHSSAAIGHFALISFLALSLQVQGEPVPSAKEILASVRMMESQQQIDLQGQLRQDDKVVPFHLVQNGPLIRYTFANPDEVLQLRLGDKSSRLDLVTGEGTKQFEASKLKQRIRGTGVTYGDLAFKFLYWPTARVLGEENVRTRNCWKLQLRAPSRESQYSNVLLWIDKVSGALMRMEGYDWNAQLAKRFEVVSAQKIEGRWFLKQMRIEDLQPGTNRVESRTYLEIKK
ncbi:MAG TPA: outer membrane lipoprotein-sorting protein [Candidatus Udaeobacter sp.]|nr:outer membrane lipoprotein-sorting protein [Candidatus Udaeobacter sp.]